MKIRILFAGILISFLTAGATAYGESLSFTLESNPYQIVEDGDGYDRILMDGYDFAGSPGDPVLPSRIFNILVPPDVDWESLELVVVSHTGSVMPGTYDIRAGEPDAASKDGVLVMDWGKNARDITDGKNDGVFESNAFFPAESVELLPYSQLRKWKFARVRFLPFRYNPVTGELELTKRVKLELHFERTAKSFSRASSVDTVMDRLAPSLFHNYASARADYAAQEGVKIAGQAAGYDYAIITSNSIVGSSTTLSAFVAHKESRGHSVVVVTENDFGSLTGQAPDHRSEKIRQWLINNYLSMGIEYVLLIGDPTPFEMGEGDVPMKMCWPRLGAGSDEDAPTDAFYADLTGNWDLDGDGAYGEWSDYTGAGGVDFSMEVWVGRIPVYDADTETLDEILQKIMDYEDDGDTGWRKNVLMPMSFSTPTYDGAPLAEQMKNDFLTGRDFATWTQYQQGSGACSLNSAYASSEELVGGTAVRDRWASNPYGIVFWWGHGSVTSTSVGTDGCWDGTLFSIIQTSSLDDDVPAFTFQCSCTNGYPENPRNLQYSILKHGGIGTVSGTRVSWFNTGVGYGQFDGSSTNSGIGYEYVDRLTQSQAAGRALFEGKLSVVPNIGSNATRLMNQFVFNLYGDPSVRLGGCETDADCDDGLWCNGAETCAEGQCQTGEPVICDDGSACTDDICNEELQRCENLCNAEAPDSSCCGDSVCGGEAVCQEECIDEDGDGYGSPASVNCPHVEEDCNDADPDVNPGRVEIQGNGIDDDCRPDTPGWGTPASVLGDEYSRSSDAVNYLVLILAPAAVVPLWKRLRIVK